MASKDPRMSKQGIAGKSKCNFNYSSVNRNNPGYTGIVHYVIEECLFSYDFM
jgi:hypothetical protein